MDQESETILENVSAGTKWWLWSSFPKLCLIYTALFFLIQAEYTLYT